MAILQLVTTTAKSNIKTDIRTQNLLSTLKTRKCFTDTSSRSKWLCTGATNHTLKAGTDTCGGGSGDPASQQLSKWMVGMTGQPFPCPPLSTIDDFINVSLACLLPPRPYVAMKMNSPAVKWCPGKKMEGEKGDRISLNNTTVSYLFHLKGEVWGHPPVLPHWHFPTWHSVTFPVKYCWYSCLGIKSMSKRDTGIKALTPSLLPRYAPLAPSSSHAHTASPVVSTLSFTRTANDGRWCHDLGRLPEHFQRQGYLESAAKNKFQKSNIRVFVCGKEQKKPFKGSVYDAHCSSRYIHYYLLQCGSWNSEILEFPSPSFQLLACVASVFLPSPKCA